MISNCPICSNTNSNKIYEARVPVKEYLHENDSNYDDLIATIHIIRCYECEHAYIQNYNSLLDDDFYSDAPLPSNPVNPKMQNKLLYLLEWIGKDYIKNKRVLEIGSGSGHLARIIAEQAKSVTIVEPNKSLNNDLLPEENINLISGHYQYNRSMGLFDLVICRQVIEHIQNPINFVNDIISCLKPDGYAYLEVPNADYIYANNMIWDFHFQHIHYFTFSSFINAVKQAGLYYNRDISLMDKHDMGFLFSKQPKNHEIPKHRKNSNISSEIVFESIKDKYKSLLNSIDGRIALYGANTHGSVFLNIMDDYSSIIDVTFDDSEYLYNYFLFNKEGKISIQKPRSIEINQFDNIIITAYLHEKSIRENLSNLDYKGRIFSIIPDKIG